jgi:glycosyltransferase involved in cell wall biosynthesis
MQLSYAIITPAKDEADALPRLAASLEAQTSRPLRWVIVDDGSTDSTRDVAIEIAQKNEWVRLLVMPASAPRERGAPIVRALHAGLDSLSLEPDVLANVDADVTMEPDYFERLLGAFCADTALGIASGSAWELMDGAWQQRFVTGGTVWGATRAYRWACLKDVLPLEERHGWDGIDQLKARAGGWRTATLIDLPFRHHRREGHHEASTWNHWLQNGDTAHFMGYKPWYLVSRAVHHMRRDPAAFGLIHGYLAAAARGSRRLEDPGARRVLQADQSVRRIFQRRREALGLVNPPPSGSPPKRSRR